MLDIRYPTKWELRRRRVGRWIAHTLERAWDGFSWGFGFIVGLALAVQMFGPLRP